jgi:hypothetical protein
MWSAIYPKLVHSIRDEDSWQLYLSQWYNVNNWYLMDIQNYVYTVACKLVI